jgi:hypothetical protein
MKVRWILLAIIVASAFLALWIGDGGGSSGGGGTAWP